MESITPRYIRLSFPVSIADRAPWYKNTFPTYFGIFLWVGFYQKLAAPTIGYAGPGVCFLALAVAGFLCFALYYYVPAMLGMRTGQPLYVVGSSTFGAKGGHLVPGLLMGFLQVGWVAVISSVAAEFIMKGLGEASKALFTVIVVLWVYSLAWVAIKGIRYVGQAAKFLNWVPLIMIVVVFSANRHGITHYQVPHPDAVSGFLSTLTIVIGFFATAGAAGADFGMSSRSRSDIVWGGVFGITVGVLIAGGLPILSVAGCIGRHAGTSYDYTAAIASVGPLAPLMYFLFAAASLVTTCFSSFIASNSFSTMLPRISRATSTIVAVTVSALLAITGVARNLVGFFSIVGASFGPICGAMAADYVFAGRKWSGPRQGINWAGYIAWATGFVVGISNHFQGIPAAWIKADNPSVLYSFFVGFFVYLLLARTGLCPAVISEGPTTVSGSGAV